MPEMDYYQVLGVQKNATTDEIHRSFRKLAKKYHPDRNPGNKAAEKRFKEISAAHEVLGDPEKRGKYDQLREAQARGFATGDFSDFFRSFGQGQGQGRAAPGGAGSFGDLFSNLFGGRSGATQAAPQRGEDMLQKVDIPFETAIRGGTISLRLRRPERCPTCGGSGASPGSSVKTCPACGGRGTVQTAQGGFAFSRPCPECLGRGKRIAKPCATCGGQGRVQGARSLSVKIPKAVSDGAKIRLSGEGEPGTSGGPPGDLYLEVHVLPHPYFERDGHDLYSTVELNIVQAALGTSVPVRTLDGTVQLRIPPGTGSGARLRLRGKGVATRGGERGDHYVRIKIAAPKHLSSAQADLLRRFAQDAKLQT